MKKDQISDPVRSSFGFHVIKVTDHTAAGTLQPSSEVKPKLLSMLKRQKQDQEFGEAGSGDSRKGRGEDQSSRGCGLGRFSRLRHGAGP